MGKLLLAVAWGALLAGLGVRVLRKGPAGLLAALPHGLSWEEAGPALALPAAAHWFMWLLHAGGLTYLWRLAGSSYPRAALLGLASAALLIGPQLRGLVRGQPLEATPLSALLVPEAVAALRALRLLPATTAQALLPGLAFGAAAYALAVQVQRRWGRGRSVASPLAPLLLAATVAWALAEYLGARTHGVTGSDPYCYAQMAVDVARRGDPRHIFSLFAAVRDLGIPWWPVVHVGYYPPEALSGAAPTVWPVGWPVLLAGAYRLLGEAGLYVAAPVAGLAALWATAALVREVWPERKPEGRWLGVAISFAVLATSREQVLQLLVPMADVPAQLCTLLAIWLALRAGRRDSTALAALAGGALGLAYDIRHTQVLLVPVLALALVWGSRRARRWPLLLAAGAACLAAAVPDLWYHRLAFGSVWHPESPEIGLIGAQHSWANAQRMAGALAAQSEFGLLLPALGFGLWSLWRDDRRAAVVLAAWVAVVAGSHFLYGPLRWRDLLSILPALAALTGYGAVQLVLQVRAVRRAPQWAAGAVALALVMLMTLRTGTVLGWPLHKGEMIFGYLTASQRRAFDTLADLVDERAAVGTALNSGPVELYAEVEAFRPGDWDEGELEVFLTAMAAAARPVYLLDDGNEHAAVVRRLAQEGRLEPVRALDVPLYGDPQELTGMLYRVRP